LREQVKIKGIVMDIELNINDVIKALNQRYVVKEQFDFIKKIDVLIAKIDILSDIKNWIFFVENKYLECYIKSSSEEYSKIVENAEFFDEHRVYFLYKVLLELHEFHKSIKVRIKVYTGQNELSTWRHKVFFQKLLNSFENINLSVAEQIENLDKLGKKIDYHNKIKMHGNTKSLSRHLLEIEKYKSFRPNRKSELNYTINQIRRGYVKVIYCPVCGKDKKLYWNNKGEIFKSSSRKVVFICDHIKSDYYGRLPVEIDLKKYKDKLKGIDEIDWVIYNYKYLFEEFMNQVSKNIGFDYAI